MILKITAILLIVLFSLQFFRMILKTDNIVEFVQTLDFWVFIIAYIFVIGVGFLLKKVDEEG